MDQLKAEHRDINNAITEHTGNFIVCPADMPSKSRKAFLQQMVENLPDKVKNRLLAMKHLQLQQIKMSEQFFRDVYALEKSYYEQAQNLHDLRTQIITGEIEPEPQNQTWKDEEDELLDEIKNSDEFQALTHAIKRMPNNVRGVPKFWLTVFRNVSQLSECVQDHDEPLLESLVDIRISYESESYTFHFCFEPNEYISELVLTKRYYLRNSADDNNPFGFEGPEIYKCDGCNVPWREGKDLTVQIYHESTRGKRCPKYIQRQSFFRFFTPPAAVDLTLADEPTKLTLGADFELGYLLRTQIVPKAVLFYTGDLVESVTDSEFGDLDDTSDDEEDVDMPQTPVSAPAGSVTIQSTGSAASTSTTKSGAAGKQNQSI